MFYKIIVGSRTYVTKDDITFRMVPGAEWVKIRTVENKTVYINLANIQVIEASEENVCEPSEIEQIVGATLNGLFGKASKQIDMGETVVLDEEEGKE